MNVQQLVQGPKPTRSSSSAPPRGTRSGGDDAGSTDFAAALNDARKKPEPEAPKAEAPAAKKPAAAKKKPKVAEDRSEGEAAEEIVSESAPTPVAAQGNTGEEESVAAGDVVPSDEVTQAKVTEAPVPAADALANLVAQPAPVIPQAATEDSADTTEQSPATRPVSAAVPNTPEAASVAAAIATNLHEPPTDDAVGEAIDADPAPISLNGLNAVTEEEPLAITAEESPEQVKDVRPALFRQQRSDHDGAAPQAEAVAARSAEALTETAPADEFTFAAESAVTAPGASQPADAPAPTVAPTAHVQGEVAKAQATPAAPAATPAPPLLPQAHFVEANHATIVTAIRGELLPNGGTMNIRLDPPELGALQVLVHMQDGVMTASFQTSSDDATKLLSHSLSHLKHVLESQGVSVEKLQVTQAPKDQQASNQGENRDHQRDQHDDAHRQEQQRKEMLRRMWRRLANGSDPLDLVA